MRSSDPRAARWHQFINHTCNWRHICSAFLFDNRPNDLLSAGHCCDLLTFVCDDFPPVVEFNVPLSTGAGTPQWADVEDQYLIDGCSVQFHECGNWPPGEDWCYFRVFDNTETGLSPLVAQGGASYRLARDVPARDYTALRLTGYGTDTTSKHKYVQQTSVGEYRTRSDETIGFTIDATVGASGSAVEHECRGLVYGIFTHWACNVPYWFKNYGIRIDHPAFQDAIANPQRVCEDCNDNDEPDACDIDCEAPGETCNPENCGGSNDCNLNDVPDECERNEDCNDNQVWDICDIYAGTSQDCDGNFVPDVCELGEDCNNNQTLDICDVIGGSSEDCNLNLIPDECEPNEDCNDNQMRDICDIGAGTSNDCNCSSVPDECELIGNDCNENEIPDDCELVGNDCNGNEIPDDCDIASGTSWDCDQNGTPYECQPESGACCLQPFGQCVDTLDACCNEPFGLFFPNAWCDAPWFQCPSLLRGPPPDP